MSNPTGPFLPTGPLVAVGWLGQRVPGLAPAMVATRLPRDVATWADAGFVQVTIIPAAGPVDSGDTRRAFAQVDCWGVNVAADGSAGSRPAVAKANRLAELIIRATEDDVQAFGLPVDMPLHYLPARVLAAYPSTEPSEVADDPSGYGRVTLDLVLDWVRA